MVLTWLGVVFWVFWLPQLRLSLYSYTPATDELVSWPQIQKRSMHYFALLPQDTPQE